MKYNPDKVYLTEDHEFYISLTDWTFQDKLISLNEQWFLLLLELVKYSVNDRIATMDKLYESITPEMYFDDCNDDCKNYDYVTSIKNSVELIRIKTKRKIKIRCSKVTQIVALSLPDQGPEAEKKQIELYLEADPLPKYLTSEGTINANFAGYIPRETTIKNILNRLESAHAINLYGMGGIGKTYVVKELISTPQFVSNYQHIGFFTYDGSIVSTINKGFPGKYEKSVGIDRYRKIIHRLKNEPEKTLIIIDNVDKSLSTNNSPLLGEESKRLAEDIAGTAKVSNVDVIITSRIEMLSGFESLPIGKIGDDENAEDAIKLFNFHSNNKFINDTKNIINLLRLYDYHTYAIVACARGAKYYTSLDEFIEKAQKNKFYFIHKTYTEKQEEFKNSFLGLFDLSQRTPRERKILKSFSLMPDMEMITAEETKEWFGYEPEELESVIEDAWLLEECGSYYIHPLVKECTKYHSENTIDGKSGLTIEDAGVLLTKYIYELESIVKSEILANALLTIKCDDTDQLCCLCISAMQNHHITHEPLIELSNRMLKRIYNAETVIPNQDAKTFYFLNSLLTGVSWCYCVGNYYAAIDSTINEIESLLPKIVKLRDKWYTDECPYDEEKYVGIPGDTFFGVTAIDIQVWIESTLDDCFSNIYYIAGLLIYVEKKNYAIYLLEKLYGYHENFADSKSILATYDKVNVLTLLLCLKASIRSRRESMDILSNPFRLEKYDMDSHEIEKYGHKIEKYGTLFSPVLRLTDSIFEKDWVCTEILALAHFRKCDLENAYIISDGIFKIISLTEEVELSEMIILNNHACIVWHLCDRDTQMTLFSAMKEIVTKINELALTEEDLVIMHSDNLLTFLLTAIQYNLFVYTFNNLDMQGKGDYLKENEKWISYFKEKRKIDEFEAKIDYQDAMYTLPYIFFAPINKYVFMRLWSDDYVTTKINCESDCDTSN